jgi:hypothetical protein
MKVTNTILLSSNLSAVFAANYNQIPRLKGARPLARPAVAAVNKDLFYDSNPGDAAATTTTTTTDIMSQVPSHMPSVPSNTFPVFPSSQFALQRTLIELPDQPEPQFFWHCLGGSWNIRSRLSIFDPEVIQYIDTSTWDDPPQDWNQTINLNVTQIADIGGASGNGISCGCRVFNLDFGQWLSANAAAQSSMAIDIFQSQQRSPINWWDTDYLPPDADTSMLEQVYEGETLFSSSNGFVQPAILAPAEPQLVTNNKFLRIEGASPSEGIVLRASSEGDYGLDIYLVEESSAVDRVRAPRIKSAQTNGGEIHLSPVRQGYYYTIVIQNPGERGWNFDSSQPPYQCTFNEYGLKTKFDVTYTITSADHNASTKKNFGSTILLATGISIAASILASF